MTINVAPCPGVLLAVVLPLCRLTILRQIASPIPSHSPRPCKQWRGAKRGPRCVSSKPTPSSSTLALFLLTNTFCRDPDNWLDRWTLNRVFKRAPMPEPYEVVPKRQSSAVRGCSAPVWRCMFAVYSPPPTTNSLGHWQISRRCYGQFCSLAGMSIGALVFAELKLPDEFLQFIR